MNNIQHGNPGNRILLALPENERQRLLAMMEPVALQLTHVLHEPGEPISQVYFIDSGVISLVITMDDGAIVEAATVGNEGMVGIPVVLGTGAMPVKAFCQIPGNAMKMESSLLRAEIEKGGELQGLLHRYTQGVVNQIAQSAACNRAHSIEKRCARWLLMVHDSVGGDEFSLTQEFLAQMLGVRRATVNVAAKMLQQGGLIRYSRGSIRIIDRPGLEAASCECYRIVRNEFHRLLHPNPPEIS